MVCIANYNDNQEVIGCTREDGVSGGLDFLNDCKALGFTINYKTKAVVDAELLEQAKASKLQQIEYDYIASEEQTVEVSGVIYSGGTSSVESIDSYVRLNRLAGNTTHNIWDVNGVEHTLTDIEADSVILAIGIQASANKFTKKNRKVALAVATTIAEVEAI